MRGVKNDILQAEYDGDTASCRRRAARLLGYRQMSQAELLRKLTMKGEREDAAQDAVQWLAEQGFLDDEQYAFDIARHYSQKGCNRWRITQELRRRLVPRELWSAALAQIDDDGTEYYDDD
jgi:regulatory protein